MKRKIILILIVAILIAGVVLFFAPSAGFEKDNKNTAGDIFKTEKGNEDIIRLKNMKSGQVVISPLIIEGEARGMWFFEASFPVVLVDWDGRIIAQGVAQAQREWMTENYVPFKAALEFRKPDDIGDFSRKGALILKKDNPSGLPEHDDSLEISVMFW